MSELFTAVVSNDLIMLQEILMENPKLDVNEPVIGSLTALHVAAEKGYSSCAKVLLSAGADVNITDEQGLTPLITAIIAGYPLTVVTLLQHQGCSLNHVSVTGMTALHYAARQGSYGTIQLMLQGGAHPSVVTNRGNCSPLSIAIQNGHTEAVQSLVLGNAYIDVNIFSKSDSMQMPVYESLKNCRIVIAKILMVGGYKHVEEIDRYWKHFSGDGVSTDLPDLEQILSNSFKSVKLMALYHLCRLVVRRLLGTNIWNKAKRLPLPQQVQDYVCFKDIYQPPSLNTPSEIYSFFSDNSREIYELV